MRFLPFRKYKFEIPYSPLEFEDIILKELAKNERNLKGFFNTSGIVLRGTFNNRIFKLYRRGFGNTSFIPHIDGKITDSENKKNAFIEMKIRYHLLANVFLSIWFSIILIVLPVTILSSIINGKFNIGIIISLGMILIPYAIIMLTFSEEVKTIKKHFYKNWWIRIE